MENSKNGGNAGEINFGGRPRFINKKVNAAGAEDTGGFQRATPGAPPMATSPDGGLNAAATPFVAKAIPDGK